jgi:hypothetical protein
MSDSQCKHIVWLERMTPQYGDLAHWTLHEVDGREAPHEFVSDNIVFGYCPLCGIELPGG